MLMMVAILRALAFLSRFLYYSDLLLLLGVWFLGRAFLVTHALRLNTWVGRYNLLLLLLRGRSLPHLRCVVTVWPLRHLAGPLHHFIETVIQIRWLATRVGLHLLASTKRHTMARGRLALTGIGSTMATASLGVLLARGWIGLGLTNWSLVEQFLLLYELVLTSYGLLGFFEVWSETVDFGVFVFYHLFKF